MAEAFEELFARAKRGDRTAMQALLENHLDALRAYVRLKSGELVRMRESCSDLVQTVCRQVLEDLDDVEFQGEMAFRNWLFTVAEHRIQNRARFYSAEKRTPSREVRLGDESVDEDEGVLAAYRAFCTPSRHAAASEEVQRIEAAMDALPPAYRDAIVAAKLVGRPVREIAAELGKSEEAVRQLLARARARLAMLLHGK